METIQQIEHDGGTFEYASRLYANPSMIVIMQSTDGKQNMWMIWQGMYEPNPEINPAI